MPLRTTTANSPTVVASAALAEPSLHESLPLRDTTSCGGIASPRRSTKPPFRAKETLPPGPTLRETLRPPADSTTRACPSSLMNATWRPSRANSTCVISPPVSYTSRTCDVRSDRRSASSAVGEGELRADSEARRRLSSGSSSSCLTAAASRLRASASRDRSFAFARWTSANPMMTATIARAAAPIAKSLWSRERRWCRSVSCLSISRSVRRSALHASTGWARTS